MDNRQKTLHGPGIYYFRMTGARQQAIFRSVFEYDYTAHLLSHIDGSTLLAYVFFDHEIHCVLDCQRDWPGIIDDIRDRFTDQHERLWDAHKAVISEEISPVLVDEQACLADLIITLHQLPVSRNLVPDASMYSWSSDHHYRSLNPPGWIDCGRMLNQVCQTRHNRSLRYESLMNTTHATRMNLNESDHPEFLLFGRPALAEKQQARAEMNQPGRSANELRRLRDDALQLIAGRFGITLESLKDSSFRRQYQRLMPLVAWLLEKRQLSYETIADLLDEDEDTIPLWLRGIPADHPQSLLDKLSALWSPAEYSTESPAEASAEHSSGTTSPDDEAEATADQEGEPTDDAVNPDADAEKPENKDVVNQ